MDAAFPQRSLTDASSAVRVLSRQTGRELTSPGNREALARSLEQLVAEAYGRELATVPAASAKAVVAQARLLSILALHLRELETPVSPRGVALTQALIADCSRPLQDRARDAELGPAIARALLALEETA